jgi:lysozyme family protein
VEICREDAMTAFQMAFAKTFAVEGAMSDDTKDSGGPTRFGITEVVARANGYEGTMETLPFEFAQKVLKTQWWDLLNLEQVAKYSQLVAEEVFDTAVNCGQGIAGKFLQRALNVLNREEKDFPDIRADGLVGPMTIQALRLYLVRRHRERGEELLLRVLNALQGARYVEIAEARRKDERFVYGWFLQRVKL